MMIFRTGRGIGDVFLASGVLKAWYRQHNARLYVETLFPELFIGHPAVRAIWRDSQPKTAVKNIFDRPGLWRLGSAMNAWLERHTIQATYPFPCRGRHLIGAMADSVGVTLLPHERRPFIHLTQAELLAQQWANAHIVVQSSSTTYWTANKHWLPGRMQAVVNDLRSAGYKLIQLGVSEDTALEGVRDMRDQTTLRESAAILANAQLLIGLEGGLMHLARAVDTRAVIIYTGYTLPEETGYPENSNLRDPAAGEPCWLREPCEHCRASAEAISADMVIEAALGALRARPSIQFASSILLSSS